jgi:DNA-binding CsgD family transcriptional regulator
MSNDIQISEREREILRLVVTGATNQQIALQLDISVNTVKVHLRNIFGKIGVVSRTEAAAYALRHGLVPMRTTAEPQPTLELIGAPEQIEPPVVDETALPEGVAATTAAEPAPAPVRRWPWLLLVGLLLLGVLLSTLLLLRPRDSAEQQPQATLPTAPSSAANASRWSTRAPLPLPSDHMAVAAFDLQQEIYVFGGLRQGRVSSEVYRYDPLDNLWVSIGEQPDPVQHASAVTLRGKIYLPGGEDTDGNVQDRLAIYDPRSRRWSLGPPLPEPRSRYALVNWEGRIYLIGGWDGQSMRAEVFIFDPETERWSLGPALPRACRHAGAVIAAGRLYLIGGEDATGSLRDGWRLDPGDELIRGWSGIAPLPQAVGLPAAVAQLGMPLIFDPVGRIGFRYDQNADAWQSFAIPDTAPMASSAVALDTGIYFVTGTTSGQPGAVSHYQPIFTVFLP